MRRMRIGFLCGLIMISFFMMNTKAFGNEIISLKQKDETEIMANKEMIYIVETEGLNTTWFYVKLVDETGSIVQEIKPKNINRFFVGTNYKFKINIPKQGKYTLNLELRRAKDGLIIDEKSIDLLCEKNYNEVKNRKVAYLTFDDGPSLNTLKILNILEKYDIKATFFVLGKKAEINKETIKLIHDKGHIIGNHSYSHKYEYLYAKVDNFVEEILKTEEILRDILGEYDTKMIRFPGGSFRHKKYEKAIEKMGYKHYNWNIDSGDSRASLVDKDKIVNTVMETLWYKHIIILFHDATGKNTTPEAVEEVIVKLMDKGYEFDSINEDTMDSF